MKEFIFNAFINLEPVQRSEDGCDMRSVRNFNHITCKTVLNLLEAIYWRLRKIVIECIVVLFCFAVNLLECAFVTYLLTYFLRAALMKRRHCLLYAVVSFLSFNVTLILSMLFYSPRSLQTRRRYDYLLSAAEYDTRQKTADSAEDEDTDAAGRYDSHTAHYRITLIVLTSEHP